MECFVTYLIKVPLIHYKIKRKGVLPFAISRYTPYLYSMNILLLEPFCSGSHQQWVEQLSAYSKHNIQLLSLQGSHWKWRMHGGAVTLAQRFLASDFQPDLIVASDMLDLTTFQALTRKRTYHIRTIVYFHENQLTYPWSPTDKDVQHQRDTHYSFINYATALTADAVCFNSEYHRTSFLEALPGFLKAFPDHKEPGNVEAIAIKSKVLPLGLDLKRFDEFKHQIPATDQPLAPIVLWNHRWEYDKNPKAFFQLVFELDHLNIDFRLVVLGESYRNSPPVFKTALEKLSHRIVHWGFTNSFDEYARLLWQSAVLPVTSNQDFFGISAVEAIYCNTMPILPHRLAFPQHIPTDMHAQCLYNSEEELLALTISALQTATHTCEKTLQNHVGQYDWEQMIKQYDTYFEEVAKVKP